MRFKVRPGSTAGRRPAFPQTDRPTAARAGAFTPAGLQYITQTHSILALVGAGLSVALLPQSVEHFCPADILLKTVEALDGINADLMLAWRSQSEIPPPAVLQVLKAEAVRHREAITQAKSG